MTQLFEPWGLVVKARLSQVVDSVSLGDQVGKEYFIQKSLHHSGSHGIN